jgi:hypothetical protein
MSTPHVGVPATKPRVPSMGSSTQVRPLVPGFRHLPRPDGVLRSAFGQNGAHRGLGGTVGYGHGIESIPGGLVHRIERV